MIRSMCKMQKAMSSGNPSLVSSSIASGQVGVALGERGVDGWLAASPLRHVWSVLPIHHMWSVQEQPGSIETCTLSVI